VLQNPAELLKVRVVPDAQAGSVRGLRLFGIKPDSLLAALGIQEGDRLDAINGMGLGDAEAMMTALARLRLEKHLVVKVQRAGKEVNLDINVV
jgi:general secretion pathway protein C